MAKKKYKSYLSKIGGTAAIAMAMAVAISAQAYAEDGTGSSDSGSSSSSSSSSESGSSSSSSSESGSSSSSSSESSSGGGSSSEGSSGGGSSSESSSGGGSSSEGSSGGGSSSEGSSRSGEASAPQSNSQIEASNSDKVASNSDKEESNSTVGQNNDTVADHNDQTIDSNQANAGSGDGAGSSEDGGSGDGAGSGEDGDSGDGTESDPLPDAPKLDAEAPVFGGTDDMTDSEYNKEVDDYNQKVDNYNDAVEGSEGDPEVEGDETDGYNDAVKDYNDAADDYNHSVAPDFTGTAPNESLDNDEYNEAVKDYNDAVNDYNKDQNEGYREALKEYQDKLDAAQKEHEAAKDAYAAYEKEKDKYDAFSETLDAYNKALEEFNNLEGTETTDSDAYKNAAQALKDAEAACKEYLEDETYKGIADTLADYRTALDTYHQAKADYEKELAEYERKEAEIKAENTQKENQHKAEVEAYNEFTALLSAYNDATKACESYQKKLATYEEALEAYNDAAGAYEAGADYTALKDEYDAAVAAFEAVQKDLTRYKDMIAAYEAMLDKDNNDVADKGDTYKAALEDAQKKLETAEKELEALQTAYDNIESWDTFKQECKEYQDYLAAKAAYEAANKEYTNYLVENGIYVYVDGYNQQVNANNQAIQDANSALQGDLHANVAGDIGSVGANNADVVVKDDEGADITAKIRETLNGYNDLVAKETELVAQAAALEVDTRKDAPLDSQDYADYLAAVQAYNNAVTVHNLKITAYNDAVTKYNAAVDAYNAANPDQTNSNTGGQQSNVAINWGNIDFNYKNWNSNNQYGLTFGESYLTHMDVRYNAAASKDVTYEYDANGNVIGTKYEETETKYTVTGVYKNSTTADTEMHKDEDERDYSLLYSNDNWAHSIEQPLKETDQYDEFGNDLSWDHTGAYLDTVTGEIKFYVTLLDSNSNAQGISVNLDANSVYAQGSYYTALNDAEIDKLDNFYIKNGNEKVYILRNKKIVASDGTVSYDISGQSVYVISTLTCDGTTRWGDNINAHGLDLVLNLQTMIEIHKADNAQKIGYLDYELGKTAQATAPTKVEQPKGEAPTGTPPTPPVLPGTGEVGRLNAIPKGPDKPGKLEPTNIPKFDGVDPGDFDLEPVEKPKAPEEVKDPGDFTFNQKEPEVPDNLVYLMECADTLDTLDKKIIKDNGGNGGGNGGGGGGSTTVTPEKPAPQTPAIDIEEEDVPLADAPVVEVEDVEFIVDEDVPLVEWVLDAEDVTGIPQTGDSNNMMGFGSVALVALAGMFGLRKKKGN